VLITAPKWIDPSGDEKPELTWSFVVKDTSPDAPEAVIEEIEHSRARS
jgi:hypothetical protein